MAASVVRAARSLGVPAPEVGALSHAHAVAMEPRVAALDDDHHPLYLHPGRSVLVLLRDVGCTEGAVLCAAALTESEDDAFRIALPIIGEAVGPGVAALVEAVPRPGDESLAEKLVTASENVRLTALAERLDHLRHTHLRDADHAWRRRIHEEALAVYLPVAHRTHPRLAQRYDHWCRTFARRVEREG